MNQNSKGWLYFVRLNFAKNTKIVLYKLSRLIFYMQVIYHSIALCLLYNFCFYTNKNGRQDFYKKRFL